MCLSSLSFSPLTPLTSMFNIAAVLVMNPKFAAPRSASKYQEPQIYLIVVTTWVNTSGEQQPAHPALQTSPQTIPPGI